MGPHFRILCMCFPDPHRCSLFVAGEWQHLWFAFVPHILLPQRGGNFAYPLSVLVLILVYVATDASPFVPVAASGDALAGFAPKLRVYEVRTLLMHTALFAGA
jgi:hypothetical protein